MRLAILTAISVLLGGCSAIVHFDRGRLDGGGTGCDETTHSGCAADQLCCNGACVTTSTATQCEMCGVACTSPLQCEGRTCVECTADGAGCSAAMPICVSGTCMPCNDTDRQCQPPLVCQTATGECGCGSDVDCAAGSPTTPICGSENVCTGCTSPTECMNLDDPLPPQMFCLGDGSCADCMDSGDCAAAAPICATGSCRTCTSDPECAAITATLVCDEGSGRCVECTGNGDCGGNTPFCRAGVCDACAIDGECDTGECVTASSTASLVGSCAQCDPGGTTVCTGGMPICDSATATCVPGCTPASCTGNTPVCNTGTGICGPCTGNGDCGAEFCVGGGGPSDGSCGACDPGDDEGCTNQACQDSALGSLTCVDCLEDADCGAGYTCETTLHRCDCTNAGGGRCACGGGNCTDGSPGNMEFCDRVAATCMTIP